MEPQSTGCIALFRLEVLVWHGGQAQYVRKRETLYGGRAKVVLNKVFKLFEASKVRQVFLVAGGLYLVTFKILSPYSIQRSTEPGSLLYHEPSPQ